MKLRNLLAASAFATASALSMSFSAEAKIAPQFTDNPQAAQAEDSDASRQYGERRRGDREQNRQQPPAGYQPPPPPPAAAGYPPGQSGGWRPRDGHRPPPPPAAEPRYYGDGHGRDRDRKRRRERFRDGAAVVLGLGVLGALAQPRYNDPYYGYTPPPPPPPPQPGYGPYADDPYDYQPGPDPYYGGGYGPGAGLIRCSSNDYRTTWCAIPRGARASIHRRLSSASCNYGRDWGFSPGAIWVANGCRAEFAIF